MKRNPSLRRKITRISLVARQRITESGIVPRCPCIVGVVDSRVALRKAAHLRPGTCEYLEWRADRLGPVERELAIPWIVTARHPAEGGFGRLSTAQRRELLMDSLQLARLADVEVRSLDYMRTFLREASNLGVGVIASFHDFKKTPRVSFLRDQILKAADAGAVVAKIATTAKTPQDLARLLELFRLSPLPLAVMAMGPLGKISRLLFASCGSVLNYSCLDRPNVSGQWSAQDFRSAWRACLPERR